MCTCVPKPHDVPIFDEQHAVLSNRFYLPYYILPKEYVCPKPTSTVSRKSSQSSHLFAYGSKLGAPIIGCLILYIYYIINRLSHLKSPRSWLLNVFNMPFQVFATS